ncbi:MAG: ChbG/HpnK family deacetylase [Rhodospirillales bacterium]
MHTRSDGRQGEGDDRSLPAGESMAIADGMPVANPARPLVLCADDFGLAPGVSEGIASLAAAGRLSAISCMAGMPAWPKAALRLAALRERCDVGLHITLTDHPPLGRMPVLAPAGTLPPLGRLFTAAFSGRLDRQEVAAEITRQWDAFTQAHGRHPDFVDGHQHVHLLPGIREAVLALLMQGPEESRPWLRVCWEPPARVLARRIAAAKAMLLAMLSLPLRRAAARLGLAVNDSFRGVAFAADADYAAMFPRFLQGRAQRPLIMCHPGWWMTPYAPPMRWSSRAPASTPTLLLPAFPPISPPPAGASPASATSPPADARHCFARAAEGPAPAEGTLLKGGPPVSGRRYVPARALWRRRPRAGRPTRYSERPAHRGKASWSRECRPTGTAPLPRSPCRRRTPAPASAPSR